MKPDIIINELNNYYHENKMAHAYLIETNNIQLCLSDINKLIKLTICTGSFNEHCDKCNLCNLIDNNNLPSVITIKPDGKSINKDSIDYIKEKFAYKSIYTDNNYYIICEAEKMNDIAYNKMLKFLEEPEDNIYGFYICNNIQKIPATIQSRLELIKMYYDDKTTKDSKLDKYSKEYLEIVLRDNNNGIWYNNSVLLKDIEERTDIIELFKYMLDECIEKKEFNVASIINRALVKLEYNVNIGMLLDNFVIEVGEYNGK